MCQNIAILYYNNLGNHGNSKNLSTSKITTAPHPAQVNATDACKFQSCVKYCEGKFLFSVEYEICNFYLQSGDRARARLFRILSLIEPEPTSSVLCYSGQLADRHR